MKCYILIEKLKKYYHINSKRENNMNGQNQINIYSLIYRLLPTD